jgi:hypothetical protein
VRQTPAADASTKQPKVAAPAASEPTPSSINKIGQINKAAHAGLVYTNMSDPSLRPLGAELAPYDWSLNPTRTEKVADKPPMAEMLIEHLKSLLVASAAAIQTQQPVDEKLKLKSEKEPVTNLAVTNSLAQHYATNQVKKSAQL